MCVYYMCICIYTNSYIYIYIYIIGVPSVIVYSSTNIFVCQYLIALYILPRGFITNSSASINWGPLWEKLIFAQLMKQIHVISKISSK
jgi:hypothetical protein